MTLKAIHKHYSTQLQTLYPPHEAEEMAYRLFDFYLSLSKVDMALNPNVVIDEDVEGKLNHTLQRLLANEPLQYVLGEAYFYDLSFFVDKNVLIPRPETEELVKLIIERHPSFCGAILDIGTGSGCIPVALKKHLPKADMAACDISPEALALAHKNALKNQVGINFFRCDILDSREWSEACYDLIVSNPPYVLNVEKELMRPNVLNYEPALALFVDDDHPLLFYKAIADFALQSLNANGHLYFEINEAYGSQTKEMLEAKGFVQVQLHQDMFGKARIISAIR